MKIRIDYDSYLTHGSQMIMDASESNMYVPEVGFADNVISQEAVIGKKITGIEKKGQGLVLVLE